MPLPVWSWWKKVVRRRQGRGQQQPAPGWPLRLEHLEDRTLLSNDPLTSAPLLKFNALNTTEVNHFLSDPKEVDLYGVQLNADATHGDRVTIHLSAQDAGSGLAGLLRVFDVHGNPVALDDQEGGDPTLSFQAAATGVYYIGVSSAGNDHYDPHLAGSGSPGSTTGLYTLDVRLQPGAALQPDLAGSLFQVTGTGTAAYGKQVTGTYEVENRGGTQAGPFKVQLVLSPDNRFDPSSSVVLTDVTPPPLPTVLRPGQSSGPESFTVNLPATRPSGFPASGPVYLGLEVVPAGSTGGNELDPPSLHRGSSWETLTVVTPVTADGTNHTQTDAQLLADLNSRVSGTLATTVQVDWYKVSVTTSGRLTADVVPTAGTLTPRLALYGPDGQLLVQSDGATPAKQDALLVQHLQPGTYFLAVSAQSGSGKYQLTTQFVLASPPLDPLQAGRFASAVKAMDVNADGIPDLVVANLGENTVSVLLGNGDGSFQTQQTFDAGRGPIAVSVADVNGDGIPDLVVADYTGDSVGLLLGNGDGTFGGTPDSMGRFSGPAQQIIQLPTGSGPFSVAVTDLNGDGRPDLVVARYGRTYYGNKVSVLLNNGQGGFSAPQDYTVGSGPRSVAVRDVNGDGIPDVVTANTHDDTLSVLLGNGDGSFGGLRNSTGRFTGAAQVIHLPHGSGPASVAVADLNGDQKPDLVVADQGGKSLRVLLGNGDGTFGPQQTYATPSGPIAVAVADVNGDGIPDLVSANYGYVHSRSAFAGNTVSVLLGKGDGTFLPQQPLTVGLRPYGVAVADLNGDGTPDLVSANQGTLPNPGNTLSVLLGNGDGSFRQQQIQRAGSLPFAVAAADLNGDGKQDLVVANYTGNTVTVLLGNGDGTFQPQATLMVGSHPYAVTVADVNGDGKLDLVVANFGTPQNPGQTVSVLLGNGDGSFGPQQTFAAGPGPASVAVADVTGDGRPDLIVADAFGDAVSVLPNLGGGRFGDPIPFQLQTGAAPHFVVVADVNGDKHPDLLTANFGNRTVSVLLGDGHGHFQDSASDLAQHTFRVGKQPDALAVADLNGDPFPDIVAANFGDNTVSVLLGNGDGSFKSQQVLDVGVGPASVFARDVNGAGHLDLVVANQGTPDDPGNTVSVLLGNGDGSFQDQQLFTTGLGPDGLTVVDVNNDGRLDLVTANEASNNVTVLLGDGTSGLFRGDHQGNFQPQRTVPLGVSPVSVTAQEVKVAGPPIPLDVNGDGQPDLVTANYRDDTLSVLLGNGDGTFQTESVLHLRDGSGPFSVVAADVNGDGTPDLVVADYGRTYFGHRVSVLLGKGDGTFGSPQTFAVGSGPRSVAVADLNGDGKLDLVTADYHDDTLAVLLGNGDGTFGGTLDPNTGLYTGPAQLIHLPTGSGPWSVVAADVNGDHKSDLVVADSGTRSSPGHTVSVLLGKGDGTFDSPQTFAVGSGPRLVAVADVNGDGQPDVVTANYLDDTLSVLLGNGDGSFQTASVLHLPTGSGPFSVVVAEVNGDNKPDLVVADYGRTYIGSKVSVLLGDGHGGFSAPQTFAVGSGPRSVAVADVSRDGQPDLITANWVGNNVSVLLNQGHGSFQTQPTVSLGVSPVSVAAEMVEPTGPPVSLDVNGDGQPDLVTANYRDDTLSVLLGNGDGSFQVQPVIHLGDGSGPFSVVAADVNGDGTPDLVVADYGRTYFGHRVSVLLGKGDGTFGSPQTFAVGSGPRSVAVADLNGDGKLDLVTADYHDDTLAVLLGNGDGTFGGTLDPSTGLYTGSAQTIQLSYGSGPWAVAAVDVSGDGRPDLVVTDYGRTYFGTKVSVLLGNGDGSFSAPQTFTVGSGPRSVAVADLNGDGKLDLVTANYHDDTLSVLLGDGHGHFQPHSTIPFPHGSGPNSVVVADVSGDGNPDLVVSEYGRLFVANQVRVLLGDGRGDFSTSGDFPLPANSGPRSVVVADVNRDGRPDLITANFGSKSNPGDSISILLGTPGNFSPPDPVPGIGLRDTPLLADLDHDGTPDTVILDHDGNILFRKGQQDPVQPFALPRTINPGRPARGLALVNTVSGWAVAALDANPDPTLSKTAGHAVYTVTLYTLAADGSVTPTTILTTDLLPTRLAADDLTTRTGTGLSDLVLANTLNNSITIAFPAAPGQPWSTVTVPVGVAPSDIALVDVNGDGLKDVAVTDQGSGDVTVLLNDATHSFTTTYRFRADPGMDALTSTSGRVAVDSLAAPVSLAAGDFTSSGHNDLVVVNRGAHSFTVLPNDGFTNPRQALTTSTSDGLQINDQPGPVVAGDFDGDGKQDLAILMEDTAQVWIFRGDGQGHFTHIQSIPVSNLPTGLTLVPVSGHDRYDLLVGNAFGDILRLYGDGTGQFHLVPTGNRAPLDVQNVNGQPVVLVADQKHNVVNVQSMAPGTQQFSQVGQALSAQATPGTLLAPGAVQWSKLEDPNAPLADAVVLGGDSNDLLVYHATIGPSGQPTFVPLTPYFVGTDPVALAIADLNHDGIPDMVTANYGSGDLSVLFGGYDASGNWVGRAGPRLNSGASAPVDVAVRDLNGDGIPDLVVTHQDGTVSVLKGVGQGFFDDQPGDIQFLPSLPGNPLPGGSPLPGSGSNTPSQVLLPTQTGTVVRVDLASGTTGTIFTPPSGQVVTAVLAVSDAEALAAMQGGTLELLQRNALGLFEPNANIQLLQLNPEIGIPSDPSALAVLSGEINGELPLGSEVVVSSAGSGQLYVFEVVAASSGIPITPPPTPGSGTSPSGDNFGPGSILPGPGLEDSGGNPEITLPPPTLPGNPVAEATTTAEAPLVPVVALLAGELPQEEAGPNSEAATEGGEGSTVAVSAREASSTPSASAQVGGDDNTESDQVAWADSEVGPDVDEMLRQLDLDRNTGEPVPVDPTTRQSLPDDPEQWVQAVAGLGQTPDQVLSPGQEVLEPRPDRSSSIFLVPEVPADKPVLVLPPVAAEGLASLEALTRQGPIGQEELAAAATSPAQPPSSTEPFADLRGANAGAWTLDAFRIEGVVADRGWDVYRACLIALAVGGLACRAGASDAGEEHRNQGHWRKK